VDVEDITLDTVTARHARSEEDEKKRFLKAMHVLSRRGRRSEAKAENSDFSQPSKTK
jgi:plasmid stability protein